MSMNVNTICANAIPKNYPAFQSAAVASTVLPNNVNTKKTADVVEINNNGNARKEASTEKKLLCAACSFFIPGLGQAINGQWGKAVGFFVGSIFLTPISICSLGLLGIPYQIWSAYDAAKNAKA